MNNPYKNFENTQEWILIEKAIKDLKFNNDIEIKTPDEYVIGYICQSLFKIRKTKLSEWAESLIHMNHHGTLIQREIAAGNYKRASHLSERARKRAYRMLNELFEYGAIKPDGYCERDSNQ